LWINDKIQLISSTDGYCVLNALLILTKNTVGDLEALDVLYSKLVDPKIGPNLRTGGTTPE
jgi:hypothetical protein